MSDANDGGGCSSRLREALERRYGDDGWVKKTVLWADSMLRSRWRGRHAPDGKDAEALVADAYIQTVEGSRRLRTDWGLDPERAVDRHIERTIRSMVSNARRRQERSVSLTGDDDASFEPVDESSEEYHPGVLADLFPGSGLVDRIARRVLAFQDRRAIALELGLDDVHRVYSIVSEKIIPRVEEAFERGYLETVPARAFTAV